MPGKRVTAEQYERGVMAKIASLSYPLTDTALAEEMGVARGTAKRLKASLEGVVAEHSQFKREDFQIKLLAVRNHALASLSDPAAWAFASLRDRAVTFGIVDDKARLELGQATQHVHHLHEISAREQVARRLVEAGILKDLGILDVVAAPSEADHEPGHGEKNR